MRGLFIGIGAVVLVLVGFGMVFTRLQEAPMAARITGGKRANQSTVVRGPAGASSAAPATVAIGTPKPSTRTAVPGSGSVMNGEARRRSSRGEGYAGRDEDQAKAPVIAAPMAKPEAPMPAAEPPPPPKPAPAKKKPKLRRRPAFAQKAPPEEPAVKATGKLGRVAANEAFDAKVAVIDGEDEDGDEEKEQEEEEEATKRPSSRRDRSRYQTARTETDLPDMRLHERSAKGKKLTRNFVVNMPAVADELNLMALSSPDDGKRAQGDEGRLGLNFGLYDDMPEEIDLSVLSGSNSATTPLSTRPEEFLPRMCYFENTYLGGNAAYQEQLRRVQTAMGHTRPLDLARLDNQAFDPPLDAGMALTASLDTSGLQRPGRVVLQVGLQGSQRYGWRRPPLDVVLVVDGPAAHATRQAADALIDALGPRDRLGVIRAGEARALAPIAGVRETRDVLLDLPDAPGSGNPRALMTAMDQAGASLRAAAGQSARIPGSQTVILLTQGRMHHARAAARAAHRLQTQGAVVSVIDLSSDANAEWWAVANAGHGNFHRAQSTDLRAAVDAELASLSKVVARLLRLNVRLGPQTEGIRVIGSRVLEKQEVKEVKAREEATDRNLSKTMGVKADRGADDDGIQTVIPYFYGGDSHVVLIELWVDPAKASPETAVAEISLKYKDMVNLSNATARTAVFLGRRARALTRAHRQVKQNLAGFAFADALNTAAAQMAGGNRSGMVQTLRNHANTTRDQQVARAFARLQHSDPHAVAQALRLASQRRKGVSAEAR